MGSGRLCENILTFRISEGQESIVRKALSGVSISMAPEHLHDFNKDKAHKFTCRKIILSFGPLLERLSRKKLKARNTTFPCSSTCQKTIAHLDMSFQIYRRALWG